MTWQRMMFRNDPVWVLVGDDGRPVLDGDGRAEMKYRETDTRSYRPAPVNLTPLSDGGAAGGGAGGDGGAGGASGAGGPFAGAAAARPSRRAGKAPAARRAVPAADATALEVWTDGACSGNPGPMGIGVVVIDGGRRQEIGDYLGTGTNNIAELVAIERGLEAAAAAGGAGDRRIRVYSDSGYAIGLLSQGWKAKANQELVARIRGKLAALGRRVEFVKVAGHAGVPENERCDVLARRAISVRGAVT